MTRFISITDDQTTSDDIMIYFKEPYFVGIAPRKDLDELSSLSIAAQPGLYILSGGHRRYVGQASGNIVSRLANHDSNESKAWWDKAIFFGHMYGQLDKSQLDYLESMLIKEFMSKSFEVDNATIGNSSFINLVQKLKANELYVASMDVLSRIAGIDVLDDSFVYAESNKSDVKYKIIDSNNNEFSGPFGTHVFVSFVQHYLNEPSLQMRLYDYLYNDGPVNKRNFIGRIANKSEFGQDASTDIGDGIHLYTRLSINDIKSKINELAAILDLRIAYINGFN